MAIVKGAHGESFILQFALILMKSSWKFSLNISLIEILGLGGDDDARKLWKKLKGYHRRSLAETAMFRLKRLFGNDLKKQKSRKPKG